MIKTFVVAAAALVALTPAASFANNNQNSGTQVGGTADLQWGGQISRSCTITATKEGTVALTADNQWLQSQNGGTPARLTYSTSGSQADTFTIKSTKSSVKLDGAERLGQNGATQVLISYNDGQEQQVYQNNQPTYLDNQRGQVISGAGNLDVDVRTNAHRTGNSVEYGTYVVSTTVGCFVK